MFIANPLQYNYNDNIYYHYQCKVYIQMKITVRTDIDRGSEGDILHFDRPVTLKELLITMSNRLRCSILDPGTGDLFPMLAVNVNNLNHYALSHGIDTPLKDGDVVEILFADLILSKIAGG